MYEKVLLSIGVCFVIVSNAQSQRLFRRNSRNPRSYVTDFTGRVEQQQLQEQFIVEKFQSTHKLFFDKVEERAVNGNASGCDISLGILSSDLLRGKKYAIQMVDSWGKLESGIATGNIQWVGRYYECINAHTSQFSGKYFSLAFGNGIQGGVGMCLPNTCTSEDAKEIGYPLFTGLKINEVYHPVQPSEFTAVDILGIVILSLLGCLMIVGTVYELYLDSTETGSEEQACIVEESEMKEKSSVLGMMILSFSFIKNTKAIFDTTQKEGNINVLHGLRFISMTWVILGHMFELGTRSIDNGVDAAYSFFTEWKFLLIGNAMFAVDTFFFLSGLLAAYLGLKEMTKRNGKINIPLLYAYRYMRLTPAYALCILLLTGLYGKLGDGPFWPRTVNLFQKPCQTYWWTNLLYINNMYPPVIEDECFSWGWYLANDMQMFLFLPALLFLMYRRPIAGAVVLNFLVVLSMAITGGISSHYDEQPVVILWAMFLYPVVQWMFEDEGYASMRDYAKEMATPYSSNATTPAPSPSDPSQSDIFWSDTYGKPWCRMDVYFIGVLTGLILYSTKSRIRMNKITVLIGWTASFAVALAIVFGLFGNIKDGQPLPVNLAAFYNAVSRGMWGFCLMWLVLACTAGYGGPINAFLSWKAFIPLSRLTFCAYLIHPTVIWYVYGVMEEHLHFRASLIAVIYPGMVFLAYVLAYVISMLIEMPMIGMTKAILVRPNVKSPPDVYKDEIKL